VPVGGYDPEEIIPLKPPMVNGGVPQGGWFWVPAREGAIILAEMAEIPQTKEHGYGLGMGVY
jgi:hypothetical protein